MLLPSGNGIYSDLTTRVSAISLQNKCYAQKIFNKKIFNCTGTMHQVVQVKMQFDYNNNIYVPIECKEGGIYCSRKEQCLFHIPSFDNN